MQMKKITRNFYLNEFRCRCEDNIPEEYLFNVTVLAQYLQVLRDYLKEPIYVSSGHRTPDYNKSIGGVSNSMHISGKAADIIVKNKTPREVKKAIEDLIAFGVMKNGGLGLYNGFVHYDTRDVPAKWDETNVKNTRNERSN